MKDIKKSSPDTPQSRHNNDGQSDRTIRNTIARQSNNTGHSRPDTNAATVGDELADVPEFIKPKINASAAEQLKILTLKTRAYKNKQQYNSTGRQLNPDNPFLKSAATQLQKTQSTNSSATDTTFIQAANKGGVSPTGSGTDLTQPPAVEPSRNDNAPATSQSNTLTSDSGSLLSSRQRQNVTGTAESKPPQRGHGSATAPKRKVIIDESYYDHNEMSSSVSFEENINTTQIRHIPAIYRRPAFVAASILVVSLGFSLIWWDYSEPEHADTGAGHSATNDKNNTATAVVDDASVFETTPGTAAERVNLPVLAASSNSGDNVAEVIEPDTSKPPRATPAPETDGHEFQQAEPGSKTNNLDKQMTRILEKSDVDDTTPAITQPATATASASEKTNVVAVKTKPEHTSVAKYEATAISPSKAPISKSRPRTSQATTRTTTRATKPHRTTPGKTVNSGPATKTASMTIDRKSNVTAKTSSPISPTDLTALLTKLSTAYEKGNVPQLVSNFATDIYDSDGADREQMKKDYQRLFNITDKRLLKIEDVTWSTKDKHMLGKGDFEVLIREKGATKYTSYEGIIRFVVAKESNTIVIKKLDYEYNQ